MNQALILEKAVSKLQGFGYPSVLCEVIIKFSNCVHEVFSNQKPGVLLIGSTARGELSWINELDNVQLFSDIELLVVVSNKVHDKEKAFCQLITELESKCDFGELFHIDFTVITWKKLVRLDKKFFIFESKQCGIDLTDRSVRSQLPDVDRSNLNWKELNEVLLHRLNSMLHAIPLSLFSCTMSEGEQRTFALNLAKNTLDITTWLHPYEAEYLVAGFTARTASWDDAFLEQKRLGSYFSKDDVGYIKSCLVLRKAPCTPVDAASMFEQTLSLYTKGISYCKAVNSIDKKKSISMVFPSIKLFDEYRFRQRASQAISLLVNIQKIGFVKFLRNIICVRKGVAANFCYYMLLAASRYVSNDNMSWHYLNKARNELVKLTKYRDIEGDDFLRAWLNMREYFKNYQDISQNY